MHMVRYCWTAPLLGAAAIMATNGLIRAADTASPPTFSRDVLPIFQKNCQSCHRPGQIGPFSMLSYESTRPWARAIKAKVESRQMPPWFADPQHGVFANDRSLKQADIDTIVKWADAGAPQGDPKDAPAPVEWPADGWQIKPDIVVTGPEFRVPARPPKNVIEWSNITIPSGFTRDTLITSLEIKPSDLSVTHHICLSFAPHRPGVKYYEWSWSESPRDEDGVATDKGKTSRGAGAVQPGVVPPNGVVATPGVTAAATGGGFACYVPGVQADDYRPYHAAKLIPANSDITFAVHYTPTGKEVIDRPLVGFTLAENQPEKQWISYTISGAGPTFAIPPNEPNYQSPPAEAEFGADAWMVQMMPHMHLRGKDMTYRLIFPDGREEVILNVPKYDFNWQLVYQPIKPIFIPKGTRLKVDAHYDNSTSNKFNPNANNTVYPGRMTWEEMMSPFFGVIVDSKTDPKTVLKLRGRTVVGSGA
jgi:hypothetical protein